MCIVDLGKDGIYVHFLDNEQTLNHYSITYGIRQLNITETNKFCSNQSARENLLKINEPFHFTSNYELRIYQSGCFYLDSNNHWQSDGLIVSFFDIRSSFSKSFSLY